ncbi:helix-turn-helix domain-containing protein [Actinophytocola xinjiangensis]|uniref:helix-turn-helix domain-containing protein n=1 Tax=Actinophytocola xinjiangensis TaxID=485602 RepID=UPI001B80E279|nr:helix-turn-helix transcriptional regulator [Actinophytocola xinjiangensis]
MVLKRRLLVQRRKALGHSQEDLARLVGVDRSTIIRWERVETDPQPWLRRKLAAALRVSADELTGLLEAVSEVPGRADGYVLRSSVSVDFSGAAAVPQAEGFSAHDLVSRRSVLEQLSVLSSVALVRPIREWVASVPMERNEIIGSDSLESLRGAVKVFRRWDAAGVGGLKRKAVVGQLNAVAESVRDAGDAATRTSLLPIMAELAQLAGWMAFDHGLAGAAQRYYLLALHACREAGPSELALGVKVIGDMTQLSTKLGNYDDSLNLVRTGLGALPRSANRRVRSEMLGLEARAYAQLDEAPAAARSAQASVEVWQEAAGDEPAPDWLYYLNQAEVDCLAANTYTQLALRTSDHTRRRAYAARAEHHTLQARRSRENGFDRSRVLDEIRLARVRLSQDEPAEAVRVANEALALAEGVRSSVVDHWFARFRGELVARHGDDTATAGFGDRLRERVT